MKELEKKLIRVEIDNLKYSLNETYDLHERLSIYAEIERLEARL